MAEDREGAGAGAATGAGIGAIAGGPLGAGIGAVLGGIVGWLGGRRVRKDREAAERAAAEARARQEGIAREQEGIIKGISAQFASLSDLISGRVLDEKKRKELAAASHRAGAASTVFTDPFGVGGAASTGRPALTRVQ